MEVLREILTSLHPEVDPDRELGLIDHGILDSFDIVTLVVEIDAELDVVIPPEELTPENFNSLAALSVLVRKLQ